MNQANAALKANISVEIQELRLKQQLINETNREARARETAARAAERQAEQSRQAAQQLTAGVAIASELAARELGQLTVGFVQAAANMETFRNSIQAVTGNADETNRVLGQLLDLTVELVGIDTGDLISYAGRLMAAGLSAEDSITAIRGVTERVAEQGKGAAVTSRVLEQLTQAINSNTISAQDFRPILRELPTLFSDASNALGAPIRSLEDFRNAADAVGGPVQAIIMLTEEMGRASEGANLDTLNAQIDILQDQSRILAAELGEHLIPAIVGIVRHINEWIQAFNDLDDDAQAAIAWAAALATGLAGLTAVVGGAVVAFGALSASAAAITGASGLAGIAGLAGQAASGLGRVVGVLGRVASVGGLAVTAITTLVEAWRMIYDAFNQNRPFEDAVESIQTFNIAASQTAQSLNLTAQSLSGLSQEARTEIELLVERADQLRTSIRNAINRGDTEGARAFREEYRQVTQQLTSLTETLPPVVEGVNAATAAITTLAENTPPAVRFTRELTASNISLAESFALLTPTQNDYALALMAEAQGHAAVRRERDARNAQIQSEIALYAATEDPLQGYVAGLQATSENADAALGPINNVGEAVRDADFRNAATDLTDLDAAFERSSVTIPRTASAMREFTGTAPDVDRVTEAVETTTQNVDDLFDSVTAVPTATEMAGDAFGIFSDDAIRAVDNIVRAFDPLFDVVGDTGRELENFTTLITSLATGNVLGIISSTANIVLPGLTDPLRVLDFTQPAVEGDPRQLDTSALGLTPVELEQLDFSGVAPGLRALLGLEGGGEGGFNVFQARSRTEAAQRAAEATGTDRQAIEDVAAAQYGGEAYAAEVAAAQEVEQEAAEESVNTEEERADSITRIRERLAERLLDIEVDLARDLRDITTDLNRDIIEIENQKARDLIAIDTDLAREQRDIRTELSRDLIAIDTDLNRDLRDIDTDLARERRDIGIELRRDIRDSHTELARDIRDINRNLGRDLIAIDTDLARERRDIGTELTRDLAEIETDLAREIQEINTDLSRDLADIDTDLARERRDIRVELSRDLRDIETGLARDFRDIRRDLNRDLRDIDTDLARERRDIETDLAREIVDIDTELSRDQRDIALDLSRDLEDIETDRLTRIEDLNREHQEQLADIQQDGMRRREDLELDATRSFEDLRQDFRDAQEAVAVRFDRGEISEEEARREVDELAREFTRDSARLQRRNQRRLEDQAIRQARAVQDAQTEQVQDTAGIERRTGTRIDEAGLSAARADADAQQDLADRIADALLGAVQDTADALQSVGDDQADARQDARDDRQDTRIDARDDRIDARQDARDSITDARQSARDDRVDARQEARDDRADSRREAQYDREDALLNAVYATADARQEARDDRADTRLDTQYDREDARIEARDDRIDARQEARDNLADARQSARDDRTDARQSARDDRTDARLQAQYDLSDALLDAQYDREDVRLEAQYDIADARLSAREDRQDARQSARDDRTDAVFSALRVFDLGGGSETSSLAARSLFPDTYQGVSSVNAAPPALPPTVTQPAPTTPQGNQMAIINMEFPDGTIKELRGQIVQQQQDGRGL